MNEVLQIRRTAHKMDQLIQYALDFSSMKYLQKIKNTSNNKVQIYKQNSTDRIVVQYAQKQLFGFSASRIFKFEPTKVQLPNGSKFEIRVYDKDELFNLSTIHSTEELQWVQVLCYMKSIRHRNVQLTELISEDLVYEALASFKTQFQYIDPEKFKFFKEY